MTRVNTTSPFNALEPQTLKMFAARGDIAMWSNLESSTLGPDEIHVWRIDLNLRQNYLDDLFCLLSEDEKNKAERFRSSQTRNAFIARRGLLRILLSRYVCRDARDLHFTYNAFDKPMLATPSESYTLHFNVSHADDIAVIAISRSNVGIDVERIDNDYPCLTIAEEFFAPHEVVTLHALSSSEIAHTFFRYWTAKEAIAKAIGTGLSVPLHSIRLEFFEGKLSSYANVLFSTCDVWHVHQFELQAGLIVALASRNPVQHVIYSDHLRLH